MINSKSKMVSFRLSPDEYQLYRRACEPHGVASLSELARTAMHRLVRGLSSHEPPAHLWQEVRELRERITFLSNEVERLNHRVSLACDTAAHSN